MTTGSLPIRRRRARARQRLVASLSAAAMLALTAGCADSDSSTGASGDGASSPLPSATQYTTPPEGDRDVTAAAEALAAKRPTGLKTEPKTIGLVNVLYAATVAAQIQDAFIEAAGKLGWKVETYDAGGDPAKMASGMANFVNKKVDAIIDLSLATGAISQQLADAAKAGIPVINVGGAQDPDENLKYQYVIDDVYQSQVGAEAMVKNLKEGDTVGMLMTPTLLSLRLREDTAKAALTAAGIKTIENQVSLTDVPGDVNTAVNAMLSANPDLDALYAPIDAALPMVAQILRQRDLCGKVQLYGYYDPPDTLAGVRDGCITGTVAVPANTAAYAAVDQLALYFANGTEMAADIGTQEKEWGLQMQNGPSTIAIDKTNVPDGDSVPTYYDVEKFFDIVWTSQFGELK